MHRQHAKNVAILNEGSEKSTDETSVLPTTSPVELVRRFKLGRHSDHGPEHWLRVFKNGQALAATVPDADAIVAGWFAWFHDVARENEYEDPEHGFRGARLAESWHQQGKLPITSDQLNLLVKACEGHTAIRETRNPTLAVCWDADRLDLARVGIAPNPLYLNTQAGRDAAGLFHSMMNAPDAYEQMEIWRLSLFAR
jgi:uncharacterized protein